MTGDDMTTQDRDRRVRPPAPRDSGGPVDMRAAIGFGLDCLQRADAGSAIVADGRLESLLRRSLARHARSTTPGQGALHGDPGAAVLTACAHLAVGELEDAYLALRAAHDYLPRTDLRGRAPDRSGR